MFKSRSILIAVALVALLSVTGWQASFASAGDGQLNTLSNNLQSYAPVLGGLQCTNHFEPNEDGTKCICPEDRKIDVQGNCKKKDKEFPEPPHEFEETPCKRTSTNCQ